MKNKQLQLEISSYSKKGAARGFIEGSSKVVEVKSAHIGEQVLVEVIRRRRKVFQAKLLEVISKSPHRVKARCPHADICGGCTWQHLDYKEQVKQKQETLESLYDSLCDKGKIHPMVSCKHPFNYRNKMEFSFSTDKYGNQYLGLVEAGSKGKVFNLTTCDLSPPWFALTLANVRDFWKNTQILAYKRTSGEGTLETLTLREGAHTKERLIMLSISGSPYQSLTSEHLKLFKEAVLSVPGNEKASVFLQIIHRQKGQKTQMSEMQLHGKDHIQEKLTITYPTGERKDYLFKISPSSFFQPKH